MTTTPDRLSVVTPADNVPGPEQGWWTYSDYAALPEDGQRYEIVNGVLYMSPAPNTKHQKIATRLLHYLFAHIELAGLGTVLGAPTDVILSPIDVFQPDVFVVLNEGRDKVRDLNVVGAPDLVVEVASPSTSTHDRNKKYRAYAKAGVREYWIAEPGSRTVELLVLEDHDYRSLGVFQGQAILPTQVIPALPVHVEQFFPLD